MTYDSTRQIVATYLADNFAAPPTLIPENHAFTAKPGETWMRWGIRPGDERMGDIAARMERVTGLIWFQIFVPENAGSKAAHDIGDRLVVLFFQKYLTATGLPSVRCQNAVLRYVGSSESGWEQWSVTCEYRVDAVVP